MNCVCGHQLHTHAAGYQCGTVTITGPATTADNHDGRTITHCDCYQYRATTTQPTTRETTT